MESNNLLIILFPSFWRLIVKYVIHIVDFSPVTFVNILFFVVLIVCFECCIKSGLP